MGTPAMIRHGLYWMYATVPSVVTLSPAGGIHWTALWADVRADVLSKIRRKSVESVKIRRKSVENPSSIRRGKKIFTKSRNFRITRSKYFHRTARIGAKVSTFVRLNSFN
jgi:hypothetical protein